MAHIILLTWKKLFRDKINTFWILCFPIVLGTLFYISFSNMAEDENINPIPVAVVLSDDEYSDAFKTALQDIEDSDDSMLNVNFCTADEAMDSLENQEISGILTAGEQISLTVSADMANDSLNQSILQTFVNEYNLNQNAIMNILESHPEKIADVIDSLKTETEYSKTVSLSRDDSASPYTQYFFNLLAMTSLFTAVGGLKIATENQANLSSLGARKCMSPANKLVIIISELIATTSYEFLLNIAGFVYLAYVLKVDIVSRLPLSIFALFMSCLTGVSLGLFIGSIGRNDAGFKQGIIFAVTMPMCFFSGLMMGNMRIIIEDHCPIINRLNPAALISDCYYTLAGFESLDRFKTDIITLTVYICIFILCGFLATRRQQYASL